MEATICSVGFRTQHFDFGVVVSRNAKTLAFEEPLNMGVLFVGLYWDLSRHE